MLSTKEEIKEETYTICNLETLEEETLLFNKLQYLTYNLIQENLLNKELIYIPKSLKSIITKSTYSYKSLTLRECEKVLTYSNYTLSY